MSSTGGLFDKVKNFIQGNPEKAQQGLDKLGEVVNQRTGGKYADQIDKAGDKVGERLGLPADETVPAPGEPAPAPVSGSVPAPEPPHAPVPGPPPAPAPSPVPPPAPAP